MSLKFSLQFERKNLTWNANLSDCLLKCDMIGWLLTFYTEAFISFFISPFTICFIKLWWLCMRTIRLNIEENYSDLECRLSDNWRCESLVISLITTIINASVVRLYVNWIWIEFYTFTWFWVEFWYFVLLNFLQVCFKSFVCVLFVRRPSLQHQLTGAGS